MAKMRDQNDPEGLQNPPKNPLGSLGGQDPGDQGGFSGTTKPPLDFGGIGDIINPPGGGEGSGQTPIERMPYSPPTGGGGKFNAPTQPRMPMAGDNAGGFAGGGASTISPPSISTPIAPPSPEFMVKGGGGLKGGSLVGGGLGLGSDSGQSNDPSSLLLSLLQQLGLMGGNGGPSRGMF